MDIEIKVNLFEAVSEAIEMRAGQAVQQAAEKIAEAARQTVPVKTGRLQRSIEVIATSDLEAEVRAGEGLDYGPCVEYGTVRMSPEPFMTPAASLGEQELARAVEEAIEHAISGK